MLQNLEVVGLMTPEAPQALDMLQLEIELNTLGEF